MGKRSTRFKRGHKPMGGRPKGSPNRTTLEGREFARRLIEDPEYQVSLRGRLIAGKAPQMEMLLFNHAYGKPVERHEVTADARGTGPDGAARRGPEAADEDHSGRNLKIYGGEITPEGRERLRRLMDGVRDKLNKEGASIPPFWSSSRAKAAGESPSATTPPDMPA